MGSTAPGASVQSLDGQDVDLSEYIGGKPVVLEFWAAWCSNCRQLQPAMDAAQKKYAGRVRFVAIAVAVNQSIERVRRHADRHREIQFVYDGRGEAVTAYDVPATSYVVVVNANGQVVYTGIGGRQNIDAAIAAAF